MAFYGRLEALLEYVPSQADPADALAQHGKEDALSELMVGKVRCLADILADIGVEIRHRAALSKTVIDRIYQHYLYVKYYLLKLELWPMGGVHAIEQRRSGLEKQLDTLLQEKRAEQVTCWQDVARLRAEARKWWKEYVNLGQRARLILGPRSG